MTTSPRSYIDDARRLAAVRRDCFVGDDPRTDLDWVARVTQRTLCAEVAALSIVDDTWQHFVSRRGLGTPEEPITGTPLSHSLCRFVVERDAPLVVHDAPHHRVLAVHPAVAELGVMSYAGVPVKSYDCSTVGALCVISFSATRIWGAEELADLERIARLVQHEIKLGARRGVVAACAG